MELNVWTIVSALLGIVAVIFGIRFQNFKNLGKEAIDVLVTVFASVEDNNITDEEQEKIKKEANELKNAWKTFWGGLKKKE